MGSIPITRSLREWLSWWSATLPRSRPRVRVPSRALKETQKDGIQPDTIFLCFRAPPGLEGSRSPLRSGRCETNVHRTFRNVSRSDKQEGTCGYYFCISNPAGLEGSRSPLRSGRCKANVHRTFCNVSRSKRNTKKQRKYTENLACFRYKDKNFAEKDKMLCFLSRL